MATKHITEMTDRWINDLTSWTGYKASRIIEDAVKAMHDKMMVVRAAAGLDNPKPKESK